MIDRRVLDSLLVRSGVRPRGTPIPKSVEEPVRFPEPPPAVPESPAEVPESPAEAPESPAAAPESPAVVPGDDDTPDLADADTAPDRPVEASGFGTPPVIRTHAPEPVPEALDISALMADWKQPEIVIETPDTGSEYPDVVIEAPDAGSEYPDVVVEPPDVEAPEPIPEDKPLERRLADLLAWAIDATAATAAFVADENGLPLANRESPEAFIAATPLVSRSLAGMGALVPSHAQGSVAIELEDHHALHVIWVDSGSGRLAIGLVLADALASAMIRTVRTALERAVST